MVVQTMNPQTSWGLYLSLFLFASASASTLRHSLLLLLSLHPFCLRRASVVNLSGFWSPDMGSSRPVGFCLIQAEGIRGSSNAEAVLPGVPGRVQNFGQRRLRPRSERHPESFTLGEKKSLAKMCPLFVVASWI